MWNLKSQHILKFNYCNPFTPSPHYSSSKWTKKITVVMSAAYWTQIVQTKNIFLLLFEIGSKHLFLFLKLIPILFVKEALCIPQFSLLKCSVVLQPSCWSFPSLYFSLYLSDSFSKKITVLLDWLLRVGVKKPFYHCRLGKSLRSFLHLILTCLFVLFHLASCLGHRGWGF